MSKINNLIKEFCPNGVEYKNIKDLCLENFWVMPSTPNYQISGIPYITSKNIRDGIVTFDDVKYITENDYKLISNNRPIKKNDFLISMIGTIGEVGIVKEDNLPFYGQNMYLLRLNTELVNIKFFYHYFTSNKVRNVLFDKKNNSNQGYLKTKNIETLKIPLPPLKLQEEIVGILDNFDKLEVQLEKELEAELKERKNQYKFWREKIFSFKKGQYKTYKLSDLFDSKNGYTPSKNNNAFWKNGTLPWFRMEDIRENGRILDDSIQHITELAVKNNRLFPANSIIVSTSATIGEHALIKVPFLCNQRFTCITLKEEFKKIVDMEYMYHYCFLLDEYCKRNVQQGNFNSVNVNVFKDFEFKIPSLDKQKRIVKLLNKFERVTESISDMIPAEIELRRQQHNYYKNKLLNFEEMIVND